VQIGEVSKEVAESLGLKSAQGAEVSLVEPGGPADKAGIKAGDIILKFNGKPVNRSSDLPRLGETRSTARPRHHLAQGRRADAAGHGGRAGWRQAGQGRQRQGRQGGAGGQGQRAGPEGQRSDGEQKAELQSMAAWW
jgi:hypothetical protein